MTFVSQKFVNAKKGDFFYESPTNEESPRLLRFEALEEVPVNGGLSGTISRVLFTVVATNSLMIVDADDRYGHYPPLSRKNLVKIEQRINDLTRELETYEHLQEQINLAGQQLTFA